MSIELERHCDGDCLHSKVCEADYADQLEELEEEKREAEIARGYDESSDD